jgi:hypothetical protein
MALKRGNPGIVTFELLRRIADRRPDGQAWLARALLEVWWATRFPRRRSDAASGASAAMAADNVRYLR